METPSHDIKNQGNDVQEKPNVKHEKEGDEKEIIVENQTPSQDIKNKPKVEYDKEGGEKEEIVEKETSIQDINNKGEDAQEKSKVEYEEEGAEVIVETVETETISQDIIIIGGEGAQCKRKVEHEEREEERKRMVVDFSVRSTPPSKRSPPGMQTDNTAY